LSKIVNFIIIITLLFVFEKHVMNEFLLKRKTIMNLKHKYTYEISCEFLRLFLI